ncbi:MAG: hypothetical protein J1F31_04135 [Erysipelotrichales bacterium]|nr:hypothetical protein [Erysipelotrichales bacterium]
MAKYRIANMTIELDLIEKSIVLPSLKKYQIDDEKVEVSAKVNIIKNIPEPKGKIVNKTKYYDVYENDGLVIQYQRRDKDLSYFGYIEYGLNNATIYILENKLSEIQLDEYLLTQYVFPYYMMKLKNAIWMHGSSLAYNERGYLFSAPSGVGKSTHTRLWREYVDCEMINDDKNIIVFENNELKLYGNPWSGKHHLDNNISAPLKSIIFLYQSKENVVRKISAKEALMKIMLQIIQPFDSSAIDNWSKMIDELLKIPCFELGCNISKEAVDVIKSKLEELNDENQW